MDFLKILKPKGKIYFSKSEFKSHGFPNKPTALESYLLANLIYKILNPIRIVIGIPINITDCYRTMAKYKAMFKKYNPSPTSDHFWGQVIPTMRQRDKIKYGSSYSFSTGAVDFKCKNFPLVPIFNMIRKLVDSGGVDVGQCILETKYAVKKDKKVILSQWIHISNPRNVIYKNEFIKDLKIKPRKFLYSTDNGRSYKVA